MVEDIVAEVSAYSKIHSMQLQYVLTLSALHHLINNIVFLSTIFECIHKQHYYKHSSTLGMDSACRVDEWWL